LKVNAPEAVHAAMMNELDLLTDPQRLALRGILKLKSRAELPSRDAYRLGRITLGWIQRLRRGLDKLYRTPGSPMIRASA
jgi:hypothetical protein